jgi:N-acetyl-anhydromuramyl-L-alanine amidase AmpD
MTVWIGCPKTNFYADRHGLFPQAIVIHTLDDELAGGEAVILDPTSRLSVHYAVSLAGDVFQYVHETDTAFHAGIVVNPSWKLLQNGVNPNFYTIGIALEGNATDPHPEVQLSAAAALILEVVARWGIPLDGDHVIEHRAIRASKSCPGSGLDLGKLLAGIPRSSAAPPRATATVRTVRNVNVRAGRPNTLAPVERVLPAGSDVPVVGFTVGQRVEGNVYWYADAQGNYIWAGATNMPSPNPAA